MGVCQMVESQELLYNMLRARAWKVSWLAWLAGDSGPNQIAMDGCWGSRAVGEQT